MSQVRQQSVEPRNEAPGDGGEVPPAAASPAIAVLIPSYRRPADLERCLRAVMAQECRAQQIITVLRHDDELSRAVIERARVREPQIEVVLVSVPGVVAALNAGLAVVRTDIVAFTDDDAAPRPDWLRRMSGHYAADPALGGLGGRDWIHQHGRLEDGSRRTVGRLTWLGTCIGNHHLGVGPMREVDALKGVNMSFRIVALAGIRFDTRLRGTGAQVGNELGVSLAVKRAGWKLAYDPQLAVDHFPSVRHDVDQRGIFAPEALANSTFNETLVLCEHLPAPRRLLFIAWALFVGSRAMPGLLQFVRLCLKDGRGPATARWRVARRARLEAWACCA
ncbi:MAG TPA: glycosyltransferase [Steroidobacteraceae bacterium]|nr:glycosyltransferase [Steroidobacteraceae bacterium]